MSHTELRNWLIGYDIVDPGRLRRVHRYLKGIAIPAQYSVFVFQGNQIALERVLGEIAGRISAAVDDVRAYHLPSHCEVAVLGKQPLPEGVLLGAHGLDKLLRELNTDSSEATGDEFIWPGGRSIESYVSDER